MPSGYPSLTTKQKQEIITRIKENGEKVSDLAKEYGVWSKTIYNLLKNKVNQPNIERYPFSKQTLPFQFIKKFSFLIDTNLSTKNS